MAIVIGAHGYLGSRIASALACDEPVIRVGRRADDPESLNLDLRADSAVEKLLSITAGQIVFYCANIGGRNAAAADPIAAYRVNTTVPARVATVAKQMIYFSTDYVFTQSGVVTDLSTPFPTNVYADSKARGEQAVLASSASSLVVRVSGLFDEKGTRACAFCPSAQVTAPDDQVTAPTYVPDLIDTVRAWLRVGQRGIRHCFGPDNLSQYEFQLLACLKWDFDVRPSLSPWPRCHTILRQSAGVTIRRPSDVFTIPVDANRMKLSTYPVQVLDCVGVVLAGRRWREPDPSFWREVEVNADLAISTWGADRVADAYCPNRRLWRLLRQHASQHELVLANNGPWESFSRWCTKYGFAAIFNRVFNSERNGFAKPDPQFRSFIETYANGRSICLVDDNQAIIAQAGQWGWDSRLSSRIAAWPVEEYEFQGNAIP